MPSSAVAQQDEGLKFLKREVKPALTLRLTSIHGRELRGRLTHWTHGGFVLVGRGRSMRDVPWSELVAEDCFEIQSELIGRRRVQGQEKRRAYDWMRLGQNLLKRDGEADARAMAMNAFEQAGELDPSTVVKIRNFIAQNPPPEEDEEAWADEVGPEVPFVPTQAETTTDIPASYTGTWPIPYEPYQIARALRDTYDFGTYYTDNPRNHHRPEMVRNRTTTTWNTPGKMPSFNRGNIYPDWWPERHTTGDILGAMAGQQPSRFFNKSNNWLRLYAQVLAEGDVDMARPAAEAYVRVCPPEHLPLALELLAAVYDRMEAKSLRTKMLRQGADFLPITRRLPSEYEKMGVWEDAPVGKNGGDADTLLDNARLSVVRGDVRAAEKWLETLDTMSLSNKQKRTVNTLYLRLLRVTEGLSASLRTEPEALAKVEATMTRLKEETRSRPRSRNSDEAAESLADRLDDLSTIEILTELQHAVNVFSCHSTPTADRLLYLIEERRWSGLEIDARTLYYITFHIHKYYDPARAVAAYAQTQKAGCLRLPGKRFGGDFFAAAECGIYLQRCFEDHDKLLNHPKAWEMVRPVIALGAAMCNDPTTAGTRHDYAWAHRYMANDALFEFDDLFGRIDAGAHLLVKKLEEMPPSFDRHFVRERWVWHLVNNEDDLDAALAQAELMCQGIDDIGAREEGVRLLQRLAKRENRPDLWDLAVRYAREGQAAARREINDPGYRDHLIEMHQNLINRARPKQFSSLNNL
ncbi:MAG: hypothetical protein AAGG38_02230 [Planctomycetota bacterium]